MIEKIKEKNLGDRRWFIFSEKIGKKYLTQAYPLQDIFAYEIYIVKGEKQQECRDAPGCCLPCARSQHLATSTALQVSATPTTATRRLSPLSLQQVC